MKVINAAVIDKIKEYNNIEDVIGENIKLEKKRCIIYWTVPISQGEDAVISC